MRGVQRRVSKHIEVERLEKLRTIEAKALVEDEGAAGESGLFLFYASLRATKIDARWWDLLATGEADERLVCF